MTTYWQMVENYYTTPFMELFLQPRHRLHLPSAITALLAGELEGGWKVTWRMKLFFWLVKMQSRWPLVPRITFAPQPHACAAPVESSKSEEIAHHL
jgi:FADH2-dependent halogenase